MQAHGLFILIVNIKQRMHRFPSHAINKQKSGLKVRSSEINSIILM